MTFFPAFPLVGAVGMPKEHKESVFHIFRKISATPISAVLLPMLHTGFALGTCLLLSLYLSVELYAQTPLFPSLTLETSTFPQRTFSESFLRSGNQVRERIFSDFAQFYNRDNTKHFGIFLLGTGILANTKLDQNFQHWHDRHFRSGFTNDVSRVSKVFGDGQLFIPIMTTAAVSYRFLQDWRGVHERPFFEWTDRTTRGYLVGAPVLLATQFVLGGNRPAEGSSYWRPFQDTHGVSGHAFVGAMPFITAAQISDKPAMKGLFYTLSSLPAWSRVNDDRHYLSQAILGWYLAYLSVKAVSKTEEKNTLPKGLTLFPITENNAVGIGAFYRY